MEIGYCANEHILDTFSFGSKYGMHFISQTGGSPCATVIGHGSDGSDKAMYIEAAAASGLNSKIQSSLFFVVLTQMKLQVIK